jgi:hypothetical protein
VDSILRPLCPPTRWRFAHLDTSILRQNSRSPCRLGGAGRSRSARAVPHFTWTLQEDDNIHLPQALSNGGTRCPCRRAPGPRAGTSNQLNQLRRRLARADSHAVGQRSRASERATSWRHASFPDANAASPVSRSRRTSTVNRSSASFADASSLRRSPAVGRESEPSVRRRALGERHTAVGA